MVADFCQLTDLWIFMKPIKSLTHHLRGPPSPKMGEGFLSFSVYSFDKKYYLLKIQYFFREISWKIS